ncbi:MAG TPA: hypothetical protein DD670_00075, partial [Planctomycetaceae bacterium]|nr:hypothetical protein [Planctomycetaceae bacterium]
MPIFPRRQLQLMLDELGPWLSKSKATDLINRIDHEDPDQAIPAEYELGIGWALSKVADVEIGPIFGGKNPDFLSADLFSDKPAVIEVTALSDDALSGESSMERTANIINQFANKVRKKASDNLHYQFLEASGYHPVKLKVPLGPWTHQSQYFRRRLTSSKFKLTMAHEVQLRQWLSVWPPTQPLRIDGEGTAVVVSWKKWVHPRTKTFSSMPSEAHDLKHNPLYARLKEKEKKQLVFVPTDHLKCIFLGDAGCRLLRQPMDFDGTNRRVSGRDIVLKFLNDSKVDVVCIFTPKRRNENLTWNHNNPRKWHVYVFDNRTLGEKYYEKVFEINSKLPSPYLDGYQARSWMQQGMLAPQARGQYLGTTFSSGGKGVTARISARALLEMLAGRIDYEQFKHWVVGGDKDKNLFDHWLSQGQSISD